MDANLTVWLTISPSNFLSNFRRITMGNGKNGRALGGTLPPRSKECATNTASMHTACAQMGLPVEP